MGNYFFNLNFLEKYFLVNILFSSVIFLIFDPLNFLPFVLLSWIEIGFLIRVYYDALFYKILLSVVRNDEVFGKNNVF